MAQFRVGTSKAEITPEPGIYLLGSGEVKALGAHDPLFARVVILALDEKKIAIVSVDLCRVFQEPLMQWLREEIERRRNVSCLLMVATHTHSAPIIPLNEGLPLDGMPSWQREAAQKVAKAIEEACDKAVPAALGFGYGSVHIGHNRRRIDADGSVTMMWSNPTRIPTSPMDPTIAVLRIDAIGGGPLAVLVNYACHPVVVMGNLQQYSADYPGVMVKTIEEEFDNEPLCLFLQGASGDIDTYYTNVPAEEDPIRWMAWSGKRLGSAAAAIARKAKVSESTNPSLHFVDDVIPFSWRWAEGEFERTMRRENPASLLEFYMPEIKKELLLRTTTVLIDKKVALMSMPGEAFVEFQLSWRNRCPIENSFFLGCANGFFSYFPTIRAAVEGGHGGALWTRVEVGAGERMVDRAVVRTYEMLGRLTAAPRPVTIWRSSN